MTETKILEAFAAGDAVGMATEFMTQSEIREILGEKGVTGLIPAEKSFHHSNLPAGSVTDDTEQVLYLLHAYRADGCASVENTVDALEAWITETGAAEKQYIGPSSLRALSRIRAGEDPRTAGQGGTTCGGIMRVPAAVLWDPDASEASLIESIHNSLMPTHNTSEALEAAGAYGFALRCALRGGSFEEIFLEAERGGKLMMSRAEWIACAPSSVARLRAAKELPHDRQTLLRTLFELWGTGLPSADVCGAAFAVFAYAKKDVWEAIRISAELGGDTDTIGALAAALCAAYASGHNIPDDVIRTIRRQNAELFKSKLGETF